MLSFSLTANQSRAFLHAEETFYKSGARADAEFQKIKTAAMDVPKQNLMNSHDVAQGMAQYRSSKLKALQATVAQNTYSVNLFLFDAIQFNLLLSLHFVHGPCVLDVYNLMH